MLRTRLFLGLLPLLLILVGTGIYAIRVNRDLAGSLTRDLAQNYRDGIALQRMRESARLMGNALNASPRPDARTFDEQRSAFKRELFGQSTSSAGASRAALVASVDEAFARYSATADGIMRAGSVVSLAETRENSAGFRAVLDAVETLTQRDAAAAQQIVAHAGQLAATAEEVLFAAVATAVGLSVFVAWWLAAALLKPIKALTASAVALGEGDLDRTVPEFSRDELGQLGHAFNTMAAKLRAYREATLAKVLRTQRTMEATLTSVPDPVFVVDRDGRPEILNPAAERLGLPAFPAALGEPLVRVLASGEHYLPTDYGCAITLCIEREDRYYLPRILAIGDQLTEFKGAAVILQDVTKFRLLDDAKTNLVGTVSHELKTPLTSLRMAVYLLLEQKLEGLSAVQRDLLETARDDADRLLRILDNLLDLARLEAGASTLDRGETELAPLLGQIAQEARGFIEPAGQTLALACAADLSSATLTLDLERIRHVFMNLLTNASKYSPPGGMITLSAVAEPGFVRFGVRDKGPGIPADSLARIFDRFYRAPGQEKTGAGLGLAIAREIVVAHGGSIACTSEPGQGTEFYFLLPR